MWQHVTACASIPRPFKLHTYCCKHRQLLTVKLDCAVICATTSWKQSLLSWVPQTPQEYLTSGLHDSLLKDVIGDARNTFDINLGAQESDGKFIYLKMAVKLIWIQARRGWTWLTFCHTPGSLLVDFDVVRQKFHPFWESAKPWIGDDLIIWSSKGQPCPCLLQTQAVHEGNKHCYPDSPKTEKGKRVECT